MRFHGAKFHGAKAVDSGGGTSDEKHECNVRHRDRRTLTSSDCYIIPVERHLWSWHFRIREISANSCYFDHHQSTDFRWSESESPPFKPKQLLLKNKCTTVCWKLNSLKAVEKQKILTFATLCRRQINLDLEDDYPFEMESCTVKWKPAAEKSP